MKAKTKEGFEDRKKLLVERAKACIANDSRMTITALAKRAGVTTTTANEVLEEHGLTDAVRAKHLL